MKKFLIKGLLFAILTVVIYTAAITLFSTARLVKFIPNNVNLRDKAYTHIRFSDVDSLRDIDILFIGSSHTYRGFDPRIFVAAGYSSYNLGSSSQTPIQSHFLLKRYLNNLNPKLVVLEVYPVIFGLDGTESSLDILYNDKIGLDSLSLVFDNSNIELFNAFIASSGIQLLRGIPDSPGPARETDRYISGGYVERDISVDKFPSYRKMGAIDILPVQKRRFEEIVAMLKRKGIEYIIVQTPVYSKYYDTLENAVEFDSWFSSLGPYINFNTLEPGAYDSYFYDSNHMDAAGVSLMNKKMIEEYMKNTNITKGRR